MSVEPENQQEKPKLVEHLRKIELSQQQIADFIGVWQGTVSEWKTGKSIPNLDPARMIRLSVALQCTPYELVELFQPEETSSLYDLQQELSELTKRKKRRGRPSKK